MNVCNKKECDKELEPKSSRLKNKFKTYISKNSACFMMFHKK